MLWRGKFVKSEAMGKEVAGCLFPSRLLRKDGRHTWYNILVFWSASLRWLIHELDWWNFFTGGLTWNLLCCSQIVNTRKVGRALLCCWYCWVSSENNHSVSKCKMYYFFDKSNLLSLIKFVEKYIKIIISNWYFFQFILKWISILFCLILSICLL